MEADPLEIAREAVALAEKATPTHPAHLMGDWDFDRHVLDLNALTDHARQHYGTLARALIAKHAEVGRLREALTHLDRILAFSPVSHQTREFVRAALAQEAGK